MIKTFFVIILSICFPFTIFSQQPVFTIAMKTAQMDAVREAARHAWEGYKKYASGFDDLKPLTKTGKNWYKHSLLMTPVDAWDTFTLLGLDKEASEAKAMILEKLSFDVDDDVQVFEITIRQLGALITAYEKDGDKRFLNLATDLANRMMPAFKTKTGIPYRYVHLQTGAVHDSINNPAEIGTLMMEFGQLSKITGDSQYYNAAKKAIMAVYNRRSKLDLPGERIDINTGKWVSTATHISGYIDSYFEYLYKSWLLFGDKDFKTAFDVHNRAIKKYLLKPTTHGTFLQHVDMNTGKLLSTTYGALDAFYAGLCGFAGDMKTARQIQDANYYMWTHYNIEPEEFDFLADTVSAPYYILRPENLESCFYLHRLTNDDKYLFMGKRMVDDILTHCRTEDAFASIRNVKTYEKMNSMESFFFGETLKYAYLIFAPAQTVNLKKQVFNTEAHLFNIINKWK
ncbi:MAG: glycoside hydrolase family 47 protein [Ferruginibacter sp.]